MKPHKQMTHVTDGEVAAPRYPNQRLTTLGSRASPFWIRRSTGTSGSLVAIVATRRSEMRGLVPAARVSAKGTEIEKGKED